MDISDVLARKHNPIKSNVLCSGTRRVDCKTDWLRQGLALQWVQKQGPRNIEIPSAVWPQLAVWSLTQYKGATRFCRLDLTCLTFSVFSLMLWQFFCPLCWIWEPLSCPCLQNSSLAMLLPIQEVYSLPVHFVVPSSFHPLWVSTSSLHQEAVAVF